jgi:hypothetical protein
MMQANSGCSKQEGMCLLGRLQEAISSSTHSSHCSWRWVHGVHSRRSSRRNSRWLQRLGQLPQQGPGRMLAGVAEAGGTAMQAQPLGGSSGSAKYDCGGDAGSLCMPAGVASSAWHVLSCHSGEPSVPASVHEIFKVVHKCVMQRAFEGIRCPIWQSDVCLCWCTVQVCQPV